VHKEEATANLFEEKAFGCQADHIVGNSELAEDEQQTRSNVQMEEPVEVNKDVSAVATQETEVSLQQTNMGDALRNLQVYGTGSQSSTETPPAVNNMEGSKGSQEEEGSQGSGQLRTRRKKPDSCSPIGRRPVTRSMSPIKQDVSASPIGRRLTRFATAEARANASMNKVYNSPSSDQSHNHIHAAKLDRGKTKELVVQTANETDYQRKVRELAEHCPSFDLGFSQVEETVGQQPVAEQALSEQELTEKTVGDQTLTEKTLAEETIPQKTVAEQASVPNQQNVMEIPGEDSELQELVVIASNDSGDSLDKIYASI
jgi:hypothetical protein